MREDYVDMGLIMREDYVDMGLYNECEKVYKNCEEYGIEFGFKSVGDLRDYVMDELGYRKNYFRNPFSKFTIFRVDVDVGFIKGNIYTSKKKDVMKYLYFNDLIKMWKRLVSSCIDPSDEQYSNIGGKGIAMCSEWYDPNNSIDCDINENKKYEFYIWSIKNGYSMGLHLFRKDKTKDFTPENCVWIN